MHANVQNGRTLTTKPNPSEMPKKSDVRKLALCLETSLTTVAVTPESHKFALQSSGEEVELSFPKSRTTVFTVTDRHGVIVRTASNWLRKLWAEVGHSYAADTVHQYGKTLKYLCHWIDTDPPLPGVNVDENICQLNRDDLVHWLTFMRDRGVTGRTRHSRESCVREFLTWLCTEEGGRRRDVEYLPWGRDGAAGYVTKKSNAKSPKFITTSHVIDVLSGLYSECERTAFHAQYDMGLRISELINLKRGDLPDDSTYDSGHECIPICINGVKGHADQGKERITLISRAVLRRIKAYHNTRDYRLAPDWDITDANKPAFLTTNQLRWSLRNATKQFKSAVTRAGLPPEFRSHWLRHGMAFSVLRSDAGKDFVDRMLIVQKMLGHNDLSTTEIYTQVPPQILDKLTKAGKLINRLEEAEEIRAKTYLGPIQHKERRGHHVINAV